MNLYDLQFEFKWKELLKTPDKQAECQFVLFNFFPIFYNFFTYFVLNFVFIEKYTLLKFIFHPFLKIHSKNKFQKRHN